MTAAEVIIVMNARLLTALGSGHRHMEQVLTLIRAQSDMLRGEEDLQGLLFLSNALNYMHGYPAIAHHPAEEVIYARIAQIRPSVEPVCNGLHEQHRRFGQQEAELMRLIREVQARGSSAFDLFRKELRSYCVAHADHIAIEEEQMFPLAAELLTGHDWVEAQRKYDVFDDPLSNSSEINRYESLYDYLTSPEILQ